MRKYSTRMSKFQSLTWSLLALASLMLSPVIAPAEERAAAAASAEAEIRQAVRDYDEALRKADIAAVEKFWASEYTFINPRGERLTRDDRLANLRTKRTALDTLSHAPQDERIQIYGNMIAVSVSSRLVFVVRSSKLICQQLSGSTIFTRIPFA